MTSNAALQAVKRIYAARKAGHTGSLDPLASGLLPICFGEATKISAFLLDADKRYRVTVKLGITTTTGDAEGDVRCEQEVPPLTREQIAEVLNQYTGTLAQVPPMHSAIKRNGEPLYKLAHRGIEVEREPRQITIHDLTLHKFSVDELDLEVYCSKGTYIRTLAEDIGHALRCGAHVAALRRTGVGVFDNVEMTRLVQVESLRGQGNGLLDGKLLPIESALTQWPDVMVSNDMAFFLSRGQPVLIPQAPTRGWVRIYRGDKQFMGVGCVMEDGRISPKRLVRV